MPTALILGSGACVHKDAEEALSLFSPDFVAATNNIGLDWPGDVHHWFTLHPRPTKDWPGIEVARKRRVRLGRNDPVTWAHKPDRGIDRVTADWRGSTGLLAVKGMLIELGCTTIVLAGVPMSSGERHYNLGEEWRHAPRYYIGWKQNHQEIAPFVRSMSGWTKQLLGEPTREWLSQHNERRR